MIACFISLEIQADESQPNIIWISCEDISPHLGCYGDPHAITPNLDALASEGVRYAHAYTSAGVCAPCRSGIITGMYQNSIGTHHMRCNAKLPQWLIPFPIHLRQAGYFCTNNSKTDYQFSQPNPKQIWDESGSRAHWKNRTDTTKPFFAVFNFTGCHESGIASEGKYKSVTQALPEKHRQAARKLPLPPYYPDTPVVREDWKRNYELITAMDAWAGRLIAQLKEDGVYDNTIIFFWSDHGVGLPRAKRWLYDSGTRVPLIVRAPDGKPAVSGRMVSSIDFGPTVLKLAGLPLPKHVQGRSFIHDAPREFVFGARDRMDERYDIIRSVRGPRYRYIRNYEPLKTYYQYMNTPEKGATMKEIRRVQAAGKMPAAAALFMAPAKPAEELYDLQADPHEIRNLAGQPEHAARLKRMREVHLQWVRDTGDLGLLPEAEIEIREKTVGARYQILQGKNKLNAELGRVAALASSGVYAMPELLQAMRHPDAAVRYWGATGVGNIGKPVAHAKPKMIEALKDSSPSVRIAAARALGKLGFPGQALPTLEAELKSEHQWGRLAAAIVLDEMDEQARPAIPALKQALVKQPNKYIVRVANRALNELQGTQNTVP